MLILVANSEIRSGSLRQVLENRSCQLGRPRENEFATSICCDAVCTEAILAHQGQGQAAAEQFRQLSGPDMQQLLEFLQSL
jgi:hypothetical protein